MDSFKSYLFREAYKKIQKLGDRLARIEPLIDWEAFRSIIQGLYDNKGPQGGRPMYRRKGLITDPFSMDLTLTSLNSTLPCLVSRVLLAVPALLNFLSPPRLYLGPHSSWMSSS